jgi:hypothetical protein
VIVSEIVAVLFGTAPVLMLLAWRNAVDRQQQRAGIVCARARAALATALGGESLAAVDVEAPTRWRRGRVHVSAPTGYESTVDLACPEIARRLPRAYDLVIHGC